MKELSGPKPKDKYEPVQVSFSPNGKYFASWSGHELMIWDTKVSRNVQPLSVAVIS